MFNFSKLLGKIKEKNLTQEEVALKIGMNKGTFSSKINGKSYFTAKEISKICQLLNISPSEIGLYFFCRISLEN
jgi:transcriptional regulator with XRE-family HTH domain